MTIIQAQKEANFSKQEIAVVHAPIENAEEEGDYSYCTPAAVDILFRLSGKVLVVLKPQRTADAEHFRLAANTYLRLKNVSNLQQIVDITRELEATAVTIALIPMTKAELE